MKKKTNTRVENSRLPSLDGMPEAAAILGAGGEIVHANKALAKLLGKPLARIAGVRFGDFVDAAHRQSFDAMLRSRRTSGERLEIVLHAPGGESIPIFLSSRLMPAEDGTRERFILILDLREMKEVHIERREAERAALAERLRLFEVLETLPVYVILLSPDYHVPFANKFFRDRFGDSHGKRCFEYLFKRTKPCKSCESYTSLRTGERHRWEWTGPDGRTYDIHDVPFRDWDGSPLIMEMGIDITERRRAEEELKKYYSTLEDMVRARTSEIEAAMETLPVAVAVTDAKGGTVRSNRLFEEAWGGRRPPTHDVGDYAAYEAWWVDTGRPVSPEEWASAVAVRTGKPCLDQILKIRRFDGTFAFIQNSAAPIPGADKEVVGSVVAILDITARTRADEEIRSLAKFPSENPNPVMRLSREGVLLYANEASEPLLREWSCAMGRAVPEDLRRTIAETFDGRSPKMIEIGSGDRTYALQIAPVTDAGYVNLYGRDITDRKWAVEALREKEKDLNRAQAVARTGSWRMNVLRNELLWSDENHRIFGIPKGPPMTYETFLSAIHPDDRDRVDESWKAALRGERYDIEHRIVVDGEVRWVRERAELEFGAGGELLGGFGTTQDITERKRAEEEIERSRLWLERVASTTPDIIFVLDIVENRSVYANRSLVDVLGYSPEEIREIDDVLEKAIEPEDLARAAEFYRNMAGAGPGEIRVLTHRALHKDGRIIWLENRVTPFSWDENGELREVIGISHDITDLKLAQEVLQRDRETFERLVNERTAELIEIHHELDRARHLSDIGMLASTVAHELRNPLGVIKTAAYNINRKKQGDALDKHLQTINKKIDESNQIINNLLLYARIKQPSFETVRVGDLLRESIESARARNDGRAVIFRDECGPVMNVEATLDPYQIAEVMSNILTNAAQAIPAESGGSVTVSAAAEDGVLRIRVSDTGAGIDPEILPRVFEPFFTSKSKGTGLGLSLCKELVTLHNGSIDIESEPGKGTTVTVILPL